MGSRQSSNPTGYQLMEYEEKKIDPLLVNGVHWNDYEYQNNKNYWKRMYMSEVSQRIKEEIYLKKNKHDNEKIREFWKNYYKNDRKEKKVFVYVNDLPNQEDAKKEHQIKYRIVMDEFFLRNYRRYLRCERFSHRFEFSDERFKSSNLSSQGIHVIDYLN